MVKLQRLDLSVIEVTFLRVYVHAGTEDRVLIYSDGQGHLLFDQPPDMDRRRGSVTCNVELTKEHDGRLWDLVFDLHSHHIMGAFWSATDDANERIRGPVFGVCSWKDGSWPPGWLFRRWDGEQFVDLPFEAVIEGG